MSCEHFEHKLVERAEGLLDESGAAELDAHLASCEACRQADAAMGALTRRLDAAGASFGATPVRFSAPQTRGASFDPALHQGGRVERPNRARRVLRWAAPLAGAAALAAAVLVPLTTIDRTAGTAEAAVTLAGMNRALETTGSLSCEVHFVPEVGTAQDGRLVVVGMRMRMDMPGGRSVISDLSTGETVVQTSEMVYIPVAAAGEPVAQPVNLYERLVTLAEHPNQDLGVEVLDGVVTRVFIVQGVDGPLDQTEYKVWINPHTSLPVRVEFQRMSIAVDQPGGAGQPPQGVVVMSGNVILRGFRFGSEVDAAAVSLEKPEHFTRGVAAQDPVTVRVQNSKTAREAMMGLFMAQQASGQWPESLQALVDAGYLTSERLRNVRAAPGAPNFGWIYIRPTSDVPDAARAVIAEIAPEPWAPVVVGFSDGHVDMVNDRARYDELLARARGQ